MWEVGNELLIKILLWHPAVPLLLHGVTMAVRHLPLSERTEGGKQMPLSVKQYQSVECTEPVPSQQAWLRAAFGRNFTMFSNRKEKAACLQR